jgi:hypothetical protein
MPISLPMKWILAGLAALGVYEGIKHMNKKRVFISFAIEDKVLRDFLVGQSRNDSVPFEFVDMSVKEPWDTAWKTNCRTRIKGCDGVIALVSKNTNAADGARWEIRCAREEGIPVFPMYANDDRSYRLPSELDGKKIYNWSWNGINNFVNGLQRR